jgi:hypothetical protein
MNINDLLIISAVVGAIVSTVNVAFGYWLKAKVEGSIKLEYDKNLEKFKAKWKRTDVLLSERMAAFKLLQKKLVSIRRYCEAQIGSQLGSEFSKRPEDLNDTDQKSILSHNEELEALLDENLVFLSQSSKEAFEKLRSTLSSGQSIELWLALDDPAPETVSSQSSCYENIISALNSCIDELYKDLGFVHER